MDSTVKGWAERGSRLYGYEWRQFQGDKGGNVGAEGRRFEQRGEYKEAKDCMNGPMKACMHAGETLTVRRPCANMGRKHKP